MIRMNKPGCMYLKYVCLHGKEYVVQCKINDILTFKTTLNRKSNYNF